MCQLCQFIKKIYISTILRIVTAQRRKIVYLFFMNALFNFHATFPVGSDDETLDVKYISMLKDLCKTYTMQFECGASGNFHYQAEFSLKVKTRLLTLANVIRKKYNVAVHLSPTSNENSGYCEKAESRLRGPWTSSDPAPIWQNPRLANIEVEPWMQSIFDKREEYEHRTIHYVFDPHGNIGKSTCVDLGVQRYGYMEFPPLSSFKESSQMFYSLLRQAGFPTKGLRIMIDIPRNLSQSKLEEFYAGIECTKSGRCFETRYAAGIHYFERPQVWVFSNSLPNPRWLSKDMWQWHIVHQRELCNVTYEQCLELVPLEEGEAPRKRKLGC